MELSLNNCAQYNYILKFKTLLFLNVKKKKAVVEKRLQVFPTAEMNIHNKQMTDIKAKTEVKTNGTERMNSVVRDSQKRTQNQ